MKHRLPALLPVDLSITAAAAELPYVGDTTTYDQAGATGPVTGGLVQLGDAIYDQWGATGSVSGATVLPPETQR